MRKFKQKIKKETKIDNSEIQKEKDNLIKEKKENLTTNKTEEIENIEINAVNIEKPNEENNIE